MWQSINRIGLTGAAVMVMMSFAVPAMADDWSIRDLKFTPTSAYAPPSPQYQPYPEPYPCFAPPPC